MLTSFPGSQSPSVALSCQRGPGLAAACRCASQSGCAAGGNVDEQITTALLRLQHDMATVLQRLHTLETLKISQVNGRGVK